MTSGPWWHLHFHLLGLEITLPEPASGQSERESPGKVEVLVLAADQQQLTCQATRSASAEHDQAQSKTCVLADATPMQAIVSAPPPVSCRPLCDSARRERSGVLLA